LPQRRPARLPVKVSTVAWLVGAAWTGLAGVLLVPLGLALTLEEPWQPFGLTIAVAFGGGAVLLWTMRRADRALDHRSGFLAVSVIWASVCVLGAIPYIQAGLPLADALFEATSGFTATGSTVLSNLDVRPRSFLLWRSLTQWLGGMGMVLFGVAILPLLGVGGMQLYRAEAPGLAQQKLAPRIRGTAGILWVIYAGFTALAVTLYALGGMSLFDAVCHAMTTVSTAGFSTHDRSLGYFDSAYLQTVSTALMLVGGTSFAILHRALTTGISWRDEPELRAYLAIFAIATVLIGFDLLNEKGDEFKTAAEAVRHAAFQSASIMTTTGYTTRTYDQWPALSQGVLFLLFFVGGMAGSTSGGIKVNRVVLLFRVSFAQLLRLVHPHAVSVVRVGGRIVDDSIVGGLIGFLAMWLILLAAGTLLVSFHGPDIFTSLCAAAVTLGNIGPGLGGVGPSQTFEHLAPGAKAVLSMLMLLGRLEIYTLLVVFTPAFWRY
jgi:trk system potassium uptake protein TrkH